MGVIEEHFFKVPLPGDIFQHNGKNYRVEDSDGTCDACAFSKSEDCLMHGLPRCENEQRSVVYKEIHVGDIHDETNVFEKTVYNE